MMHRPFIDQEKAETRDSIVGRHPGHYHWAEGGSIRRVTPKLKGKAAKKAAKRAKHEAREAARQVELGRDVRAAMDDDES